MQLLNFTILLLLGGVDLLVVLAWRRSVGKSRRRISELEERLDQEIGKRRDSERAIEEYYIPNWQDATERLAEKPICTCPPYPYRSSCLKHSPGKWKQQLQALEKIEKDSLVTVSSRG